MNTERAQQVGRGFWIWWTVSSTVGIAVGLPVGVVGGAVGSLLWSAGSESSEVRTVLIGLAIATVSGAVLGASLGLAQWLVLRRQISKSARWILASTAGGAASVTVAVGIAVNLNLLDHGGSFLSLPELDREFSAATLLGMVIVFGASLGIAQWFILRRKVSRSGRWILASAAGPAVTYLVLFVVTLFPVWMLYNELFMDGAAYVGAVGALLGYVVITGGAMVWLLRQPSAKEINPRHAAE